MEGQDAVGVSQRIGLSVTTLERWLAVAERMDLRPGGVENEMRELQKCNGVLKEPDMNLRLAIMTWNQGPTTGADSKRAGKITPIEYERLAGMRSQPSDFPKGRGVRFGSTMTGGLLAPPLEKLQANAQDILAAPLDQETASGVAGLSFSLTGRPLRCRSSCTGRRLGL